MRWRGLYAYDAAGNMTAIPREDDLLSGVYDGWNLYADTDDDGTFEPDTDDDPVAAYEYDGTGRRIQKRTDWSGTAFDREIDYYR